MPTTAAAGSRKPSGEPVDVLILCGGLGTRLQAVVPDRPKGLAPIRGRPFLDFVVDELTRQGLRRLVFCVGYQKEQIIARYEGREDAECLFSREDEPLGTGGAVQRALQFVRSDPVLIVNGDSYCRVDFHALRRFHSERMAAASFVLCRSVGRMDGGLVRLDDTRRIESFSEKPLRPADEGFISAGIYLTSVDAVRRADRTPPFSLEYDVFPALVKERPCFGFVVDSPVVDIGTPDRFRRANAESGLF